MCYLMSMSHIILDGRVVREARLPALKEFFGGLAKPPVMTIIQVGDRPDSTAFIRAKSTFAAKVGVTVRHIHLPESITQAELLSVIAENNKASDVHGIIVQLPLPLSLDQETVIEAIDPTKDADGLSAANVKRWLSGHPAALYPATTRGVRELLSHYRIDIFGRKVAIVGRSMLVGKPLAAWALNENATVIVCHSKTPDLAAETKQADIVIVAAGRPGLVSAKHLKLGAVVVDVGINTVQGQKLEEEVGRRLVGDVDFDSASTVASAISPVPGGVGPMTVLALFENLADLIRKY